MLINVELPSGITVKVDSDWFYSLSDWELAKFYENNTLNYDYHQFIRDPFDNSIIEVPGFKPLEEDIEDFDPTIDFEGFDD